jgi:hypothetical protein
MPFYSASTPKRPTEDMDYGGDADVAPVELAWLVSFEKFGLPVDAGRVGTVAFRAAAVAPVPACPQVPGMSGPAVAADTAPRRRRLLPVRGSTAHPLLLPPRRCTVKTCRRKRSRQAWGCSSGCWLANYSFLSPHETL